MARLMREPSLELRPQKQTTVSLSRGVRAAMDTVLLPLHPLRMVVALPLLHSGVIRRCTHVCVFCARFF